MHELLFEPFAHGNNVPFEELTALYLKLSFEDLETVPSIDLRSIYLRDRFFVTGFCTECGNRT